MRFGPGGAAKDCLIKDMAQGMRKGGWILPFSEDQTRAQIDLGGRSMSWMMHCT
jgi:hypothetical protein